MLHSPGHLYHDLFRFCDAYSTISTFIRIRVGTRARLLFILKSFRPLEKPCQNWALEETNPFGLVLFVRHCRVRDWSHKYR